MHAEILPPTQRACLATLGPAADALGFHLAGGTAVAIHLGPACRLAALEDLTAMKLLAVAQRGTKKDFIDIDALGASFELPEMLDFYQRKFAVSDIGRLLAGLTYFDDAEPDPMPTMLVPTSWDDVKKRIRDRVRRFAAQ